MVAFSDDALKRLASTKVRSYDDAIPVLYFSLNPARRALVRERYVEEQQGACWYCTCSLDGPPPPHILGMPIHWRKFPGGDDFLKHPVHLHHSHETGLTIGAVHAYCNAVLFDYHGE